jgi:lysophospholipase L1-like esterase
MGWHHPWSIPTTNVAKLRPGGIPMRAFAVAALLLAILPAELGAADFTLKDGDRVVLLGNTLIEREQRYGYWEEALTLAFSKEKVLFRNLGWSGDTVFGIARAGFGSQADGFKHLKEHVEDIKPNVILLAYGTNESFDGEAGLPQFQKGLDTLLDTLAKTEARIVILSPTPMEKHGKILPDPAEQNRNLRLYRDLLKETAAKRKLQFADLFEALSDHQKSTAPLTDNGMHLSAYGYYRSAFALQHELGLRESQWCVVLDAADGVRKAVGTAVEKDEKNPLNVKLTDERLPLAIVPSAEPINPRIFLVQGLKPSKYTLQIDGKVIATATADEWAKGMKLTTGPEFEQSEKLRTTIIAKNQEYFHRWRPDNETYLFGFRKHEQGQNAFEIPKFEPIVAGLEEDIAKLRAPATHRYEIVPAK